jgi:hypothetical protein
MRTAIVASALSLAASSAHAQLAPEPSADQPVLAPSPPPVLRSVRELEAAIGRQLDFAELERRREVLLTRRRNWEVPLAVSAVGAASLIAGGVVFYRAWNPSCDIENDDCNYSTVGDRAGLVMMPLGAALVIVGTPLFAVRLSRARRLARVERALERLRAAPVVVPTPSGAALTWGARF